MTCSSRLACSSSAVSFSVLACIASAAAAFPWVALLCVRICIYIYIYVVIYICIYTYTHLSVSLSLSIYTYVYIYIYTHTHTYWYKSSCEAHIGWHNLSNAACPMRPRLFYALFVVSRITIICYVIRRFWRKHALDK